MSLSLSCLTIEAKALRADFRLAAMPENGFLDISRAAIMQKKCVTTHSFGEANAP